MKPKKSKKVAVVLAIFFGLFSWFYTWKYDAWKFWLNLVLTLITLGIWGIGAWIWAIIDAARKDTHLFKEYYK